MKIEKGSRLEGKIALIAGAASGIGRATAILFAQEGAKLILADLQEQGLLETLELARKEGGEGIIKRTNVANEGQVRELIDLALRT